MPGAVRTQSAPAHVRSSRLQWIAWASGIASLLVTLAIIERAPVPSLDEVYIVSVANTVAEGVERAPRLIPPAEWVDNYDQLYGPAFFQAEGVVLRYLGLSPWTGRIIGWLGAVLICASTVWIVMVAGGLVGFAAIAFAVTAWAPDLSLIGRNGRMDSMAVGLELAALASLLAAWRSPRRAIPWGLLAGVFWAATILTTPRTLPLAAGLVIATPVLLRDRETRKSRLQALACAGGVVFVGVYLWARSLGLSVMGWLWWLWDGVKDDPYMFVIRGHRRSWGIGLTTAIMPTITALAFVGIVLIALNRWPKSEEASARDKMWFLLAAATFNVLFYVVVANYPFVVSQYFVLPIFAILLTATATLRVNVRVHRTLVGLWVLVALSFAFIRIARHIEVWQTWELRDPKRIAAFIEKWVPHGSTVFADDQYYYYAVENAGARYRTFNLARPGSRAAADDPSRHRTEPAFLLWPVGDPNAPFPAWFECARPHAAATYEASAEPVGIERVAPFAFLPYLHGYPATTLYRVPPGCPTVAAP